MKKKDLLSLNKLMTLLYSIYFNLRYLPLGIATRIPILVSPRVRIHHLKRGCIFVPLHSSFGNIKIGLNCSDGVHSFKGFISIANGAQLIFLGKAKLSSGISIRIDAGKMIVGNEAFFNANCMIRCTNSISFGNGILVGWNVCFITDDGHSFFVNNQRLEREKPIIIGEHVWIASDTKIAKGTIIADNCIVAQNSLVNTTFYEKNTLIGGIPAKVIKKNVSWEK